MGHQWKGVPARHFFVSCISVKLLSVHTLTELLLHKVLVRWSFHEHVVARHNKHCPTLRYCMHARAINQDCNSAVSYGNEVSLYVSLIIHMSPAGLPGRPVPGLLWCRSRRHHSFSAPVHLQYKHQDFSSQLASSGRDCCLQTSASVKPSETYTVAKEWHRPDIALLFKEKLCLVWRRVQRFRQR